MIEHFQDHARIVIGGAIVEDQHGDFAERILPADFVGRIVEIGLARFDFVGEPQETDGDADFADERRSRRRKEDHLWKYLIGDSRGGLRS